MPKRKIIIINDDFPPYSSGGAAIIAHNQALGLKEKGFEVIVLTTVNDIKNEGIFNENGIRIIKIFYRYNLRFRSYISIYNSFLSKKLKLILIQEKPEIVHFHNIHSNFSYHSIRVASKICKKVFITVHDSMPFHYSKLYPKDKFNLSKDNYKVSALRQIKDFKFRYNPFRNILIKYYLKFPNKIIAVSDALKDALEVNGIKNVVTIHNGIDISKWILNKNKVDEFKNKYDLNNKKVLMFCGRLSRAKGGEVVLNMLKELIKTIPNIRLLVVGEMDSEAQNLSNIATRSGIRDYIIFTGSMNREEIVNAYGTSDLVVVPSLCFDWFPTVNLEAMASGIPVIATCFGGSKEIISDGVNGYIINPYDLTDTLNRVSKLLNDNLLRSKMSNDIVSLLIKEYDINKYLQNTIICYNQ